MRHTVHLRRPFDVLVVMLLLPACAKSDVSDRKAADPRGFQQAKWGMTFEQVEALYPDARTPYPAKDARATFDAGPDPFGVEQAKARYREEANLDWVATKIGGYDARLSFGFEQRLLNSVSVVVLGTKPEDATERFSRINEALIAKYGKPDRSSRTEARWNFPTTIIWHSLDRRDDIHHSILYMDVDSLRAAASSDPAATPISPDEL